MTVEQESSLQKWTMLGYCRRNSAAAAQRQRVCDDDGLPIKDPNGNFYKSRTFFAIGELQLPSYYSFLANTERENTKKR